MGFDTSQPTPPPRPIVDVDDDDETSQARRLGHECPYRDEVHLIRRLRTLGIEEQAVIGRRRDRVAMVLSGAALAAALTLGSAAIIGGMGLARDQGRSEARTEERLGQLENHAQSAESASVQLGRLDARLEGLEERLGDRLEQIERRLDRSEERVTRSGRSRDRR